MGTAGLEVIEEAGDVVRGDVEVRGDAEPPGAGGGEEAGVAEAGVGEAGILLRVADADDAGACGGRPGGGHEFVTFSKGAGSDLVGSGGYGLGDVGDADFVEEFEGGAEAVAADGVEGAGFVAAGVGAKGEVALAVVGVGGGVGPAELDGLDLVLAVLLNVEDAAAFGAGEPFVTVGGEGVDAHGADVEGEGAEALDGVDEEEDLAAVANFAMAARSAR